VDAFSHHLRHGQLGGSQVLDSEAYRVADYFERRDLPVTDPSRPGPLGSVDVGDGTGELLSGRLDAGGHCVDRV
jgi:hypothetical protein